MEFRDDKFIISNLDDLHHAYLIKGDTNTHHTLVQSLEEWGINITGNPDVSVRVYDRFGIDDAHELRHAERRRSVRGERKIFVITTNQLTAPAQNALLKVFEEPTTGTHFFLITSKLESILPTLRSRTHEIMTTTEIAPGVREQVASFMAASLPERLSLVEKIAKLDDSQDQAQQFVSGLEDRLQTEISSGKMEESELMSFGEALVQAHRYLEQHGVNVRMVLENLSLQYPTVEYSK